MFGVGLDGKWVPFSEFRMPVRALRLVETLKLCEDDNGGRTSRSVCSFEEVQAAAAELGLPSSPESIGYLLRVLSGVGFVSWFPEVDRSLVVLDTQWLLSSMSSLIREHEGEHSQLLEHLKQDKQAIPLLDEDKIRRGIFPVPLLDLIWSSDKLQYGALNGRPDEIRALKRILEHFGLICRIYLLAKNSKTLEEFYVVPALLPKLASHIKADVRIRKLLEQQPNAQLCKCTWDFSHSGWPPDHVFERLGCTIVASEDNVRLNEKLLSCDVTELSYGGAVMLLRLDADNLRIQAQTVNYDGCPHASRWMYKLVQAGVDKILPRPRRDVPLEERRPLDGIFKVLLSTTDGKDTVELTNLDGPQKMVATIAGATVSSDPLRSMWLTDPYACGGDCCSQPAAAASSSIPVSPPVPPPLAPVCRVRVDYDLNTVAHAMINPALEHQMTLNVLLHLCHPSSTTPFCRSHRCLHHPISG